MIPKPYTWILKLLYEVFKDHWELRIPVVSDILCGSSEKYINFPRSQYLTITLTMPVEIFIEMCENETLTSPVFLYFSFLFYSYVIFFGNDRN